MHGLITSFLIYCTTLQLIMSNALLKERALCPARRQSLQRLRAVFHGSQPPGGHRLGFS
jgi:hypothetical protein